MKQSWQGPLNKIDDYRWEIPKNYHSGMRVPGLIYASSNLLEKIRQDQAPEQVANVAFLPGIVGRSLAMPDIHWGYGFCLTKDTKVLSNFGFYKVIEDFEKDWQDQRLKCIDLNSQRPVNTPIIRFIKLKSDEVFKIATKGGYEIKATLDHPLLTPFGMKPVKDIALGEKVAIFAFEGVPYKRPSSEIIISEEGLKKILLKLGRKQGTFKFKIILQKLKKRNLLPLAYNHSKLPYILKIMGFVFGDGSMNFIGKRGDGVLHFSGKPQDLEEVRNDLKNIAYTPSPLHYEKIKDSRGSNKYYNCCSFTVNASSLVVLLEALGVPRGSKVSQAYRIPKWIFKAPLWQKRLFLASLFGCELRIPHRRLNRKGYFNAPTFPMAKREELTENGKDFLKDIEKLLKDFGTKCLYIDKRKKHINKKGKISWLLELIISPKPENLLNLWGKIGFEYNFERAYIANVAVQYIKLKQKILKEKDIAIKEKVPRLLKTGLSYQKIANQLEGNPLTKRFIIDTCWKLNRGKKIIPRIPANFPLFDDFLKDITSGLEESGMVWDEIKKIKKIDYKGLVYDFTVAHPEHNFIAENFVVSNCIGGVAATSLDNGVISPGGVGFDINCLSSDTSILHPLGYTLKIREFEKIWLEEKINCFDFEKESLANSKIVNFFKKFPDNKVYKITTKSGKTIVATEDHPFYTKDGMIPLNKLKTGDELAIYPFEGVPYEKPSNEIILNEEKVKELLLKLGKGNNGNGLNQILSHLKKRGLLPLRYNSPQLPCILKIMGYVFGDGNIHFTNKKGKGITSFYGKSEGLEEIKRDIANIGYNCSRVYHRKRDHKIDTLYGKCEFSNIETFCKVVSSSFAILLVSLGTSLGRKTNQDYHLPSWIFKAPLWQKRLFLAAFFGAELSTPKTLLNHKYTFYGPIISMNKQEGFIESGRKFLEEISDLLTEFGVKTQKISQRVEYINKEGNISHRLRLILSGQNQDLINLYSKIGFEYNKKRSFIANNTVHYLKYKHLILEKRNEVAIQAKELRTKEGLGAKAICKQLDSPYVNLRFIERSIYEGRKTSPRISFNSLSFKDFIKIKTEGLGCSGMLWDEIISKQKVDFNDYVYDFTVKHPHHNFIANNFVVSNCGVRLVRTNLTLKEVKPKIELLVDELFRAIPSGVGSKGKIRISFHEMRDVLIRGSKWAVESGFGWEEDILFTEEEGCMKEANPDLVSKHAMERGKPQLGTLGSGNHFLEIQVVDKVYEPEIARELGLEEGQITVMIHCGSRGLGHQVCTDYLVTMQKAVSRYGIQLPDRQLACAPLSSPEGKNYYTAMACAANYAWANRQCIMHWTREVFAKVFRSSPKELGLKLIYDVAHNIAKIEEHNWGGKKIKLCVHRKGATRAFPPFHPDVPERYKKIGQPVLIPGDMGRCSYCLVGTEKAMEETFGSTCHGAGRVMSRMSAKKQARGRDIQQELREKGIIVKAESRGTLVEEMSDAYKDVSEVVEVMHQTDISKKVARMRPLGVIKG